MQASPRRSTPPREGAGSISTYVLLRQRGRRDERVLVRFPDFPRIGTGFRAKNRDWVVREVGGDLGFVAEPRH